MKQSSSGSGPGTLYWPTTDHLGTLRDLLDLNGVVQKHWYYDSFGKQTETTSSTVKETFAYTGRELDEETSLYYYRARYYDAFTHQFLSEDRIGFEGGDSNLYRYVTNDPANLTDPSGHQEIARVAAITVAKAKNEVPQAAKDITFPALQAGDPGLAAGFPADIRNRLGPFKWTAPGGVGANFTFAFWVVIEGDCLKDARFIRYMKTTTQKAGQAPVHVAGGYQAGGKASDQDMLDGPSLANIIRKDKVIVLFDNPGMSLVKAHFPASYKANFYLKIYSRKTAQEVGKLWYDVLVKANAVDDANSEHKLENVYSLTALSSFPTIF